MCGAIADGYLRSDVASPSYRLPLISHARSLAPILAERELTQGDCDALTPFYVNAEAFNRCLDYCHDAAFALSDDQDADERLNFDAAEQDANE